MNRVFGFNERDLSRLDRFKFILEFEIIEESIEENSITMLDVLREENG